jgi:hypothetical protein
MVSREERRQKMMELLQGQAAPKVKVRPPGRDLSQVRPVKQQVKAAVSKQAQNARTVFDRGMAALSALSPGLESLMKRQKSQLLLLHRVSSGLRNENIFKNCKVQYAYNQRQKIYSISASLYGRPRIITVRVGEKFMEISLANSKGRVLEIIRQEDRKGVTFNKMR